MVDPQPRPERESWEAVTVPGPEGSARLCEGRSPETPQLTSVGLGTRDPGCPDEGYLVVSGDPVPAPAPLLCGCSRSGLPEGPGSVSLVPCSGIPCPLDLGIWGTAAWTGRKMGYLDLQRRWDLLTELPGKALCLGSCSVSPSGP